ncbi:MAG: hypothetical protein GY784_14510 [Gammaproteobacteria bacterium]|nr:hypothetical protein [Gammaproteobacteria bacterium]
MPNTFHAGTPARASEVNNNFEALRPQSNNQDIRINSADSNITAISDFADLLNANISLLSDNLILALKALPYGNGSAGDFTLTSTLLSWRTIPPPNNNTQFLNFTVPAGTDVGIPSGTVIRALGNVTIDGTINVETYAGPGISGFMTSNTPASPGISRRAPGQPDFMVISGGLPGDPSPTSHGIIAGGTGGLGILGSQFQAAQLQRNGPLGGGGGSGDNQGAGEGGGTLTIIAAGDIIINGNIIANGKDSPVGGGGGGGGGIVILASANQIDISGGSVTAQGGNGGDSDANTAPGGGGGGGIINLISPLITGAANPTVTGGTAGSVTGDLTGPVVFTGGGGGGASGGSGGRGAQILNNTATPSTAVNGSDGYVVQLPFNPMPLF